MSVFVNGIEWPRTVNGFPVYAVTFKKAPQYSFSLEYNYLNIRGPFYNANDIVTNLGPTLPFAIAAYDPLYPVEEGYFFVRDRITHINNYRIQTNCLKDRFSIVSIRLIGQYNIPAVTPPPVPSPAHPIFFSIPDRVMSFITEDFLFIIRTENATDAEFETALLAMNASGLVNITTIDPNSSPTPFTTYHIMPEWLGEQYNLGNELFLDVRMYYHYHIDFAHYAVELFRKMEEVLRIKLIHYSEFPNLKSRDLAYILYRIEYQDKLVHPIYRKKAPIFDTHHFCSGRIRFSLYTSDLLIYRGFVNDYVWFEKLSNNVTTVCIQKYPNTQGYCATVKWALDEVDYNIETVITEVSSDRQYYQFQVDFSAELMYFYVRKIPEPNIIEQVFAVFTDIDPDSLNCDVLRDFASRFMWVVNNYSGTITFQNPNNITHIIEQKSTSS